METSSIPSPSRGLTARLALNCRRWNCWRSWQRWCPCRASTLSAMPAVWRRIAAARGDYPDAAPAGCGRGGGEDWNASLELGQAPGARVCSGYGHVSLVPSWLAPDHCRHHPGVGHDAHPASLQARLRPASHCTCPLSPSNVRLGRLSPRRHAWSRGRRARSGGVSHPFERLKSRLKSPPRPSQSPFPRPSPQGTPEALPSPILRRLSSTSPSHAAPCTAWRRGAPAGWPAPRALGGSRGCVPEDAKSALEFLSASAQLKKGWSPAYLSHQ